MHDTVKCACNVIHLVCVCVCVSVWNNAERIPLKCVCLCVCQFFQLVGLDISLALLMQGSLVLFVHELYVR